MTVIIGAHSLKAAAGPTKRPKGSRNKKKRWTRLNQDKEQRQRAEQLIQEHRGGLLKERPADKIFFVETKGKNGQDKAVPRMSRKQRAAAKALYVESSVMANPHVKQVKPDLPKRKIKGPTTRDGKRRRVVTANTNNTGIEARKPISDLPTAWNVELHPDVTEGNSWLEPVKVEPVKAPFDKSVPEASLVEAVEKPAPGLSYRPTHEDHQALLAEALAFEEARLQKLLDVEKQLPAKRTAAEEVELLFKEFNAGLASVGLVPQAEGEEEDMSDESDSDVDSEAGASVMYRKPVRAENRKTKKEIRKKQRIKEQERQRKEAKKRKSEESQLYQLKRIQRELDAAEAKKAESVARRREIKEQKKLSQPRLLSQNKFIPQPTEFKLTEELADSLRTLKPEGSVFKEKFVNFQKRNILEPRLPTKRRRRYRLKTYTKRSFKNYDLKEQIKHAQQEIARAKEALANSKAESAAAAEASL